MSPNNKFENKNVKNEEKTNFENKNNLIKNLRYEVNFDNNTQYIITSDLSELQYQGEYEIVFMQKVVAKIIDEKNTELTITSDNAIYNNSTYDTNFSENILIKYMDNIIYSDNLDLDFNENIVKIYNNVVYEGVKGKIKTDNVLVNLLNKNVEIFMTNPEKKIMVISK
jgi:lipopolysaccharide assembly outer membrane protein LptD (OstA)